MDKRKRPKELKRSKYVGFVLTQRQYDLLVHRAAMAHLTVSAYIRIGLCLEEDFPDYGVKTLYQLLKDE